MAATVEGSIMQALFARLAALVLVPALPIAWPNLTYTPPATKKYLQVLFVPNTNNRVFLGSTDPQQRLGLFQVVVHWPLNDGEANVRDTAGKVAQHFPTDMVLTADSRSIRVMAAPEVVDLLVTPVDVQIPVIVQWECWA